MIALLLRPRNGYHAPAGKGDGMRAIFFAVALLAGCASVGRDFDMQAAGSLEPGLTEAELLSRLGEPTVRAVLPDGRQRLTWVHSKASMFGAAKAKSVSVVLGPDGRLMRP